MRLSPLVKREWRTPTRNYKMSSKLAAGMPDHMKASVRAAAEKLTKLEGRKVSMSEVVRRLLAAGGLK